MPIASVWGSRGVKTALTGAVLVNSTAGHGFEMDDILMSSRILHAGSLAVRWALAIADAESYILRGPRYDRGRRSRGGYEIWAAGGDCGDLGKLFMRGHHFPRALVAPSLPAATAGRSAEALARQMQHALASPALSAPA